MNINYFTPLSLGWNRMKKALFQPFDIAKWFVVGFTAFLAGLMEYNGGAGNRNSAKGNLQENLDDFFNFPAIAADWLTNHPIASIMIIFAVVFVFVFIIVLTWLSSRGKFMFLYNVVNDKAEVVIPWRDYARQGNSLFVWRVIFGLIAFVFIGTSVYYAYLFFRDLYIHDVHFTMQLSAIAGYFFWFLFLFIVIGYISLFLTDFVVPIMYKHSMTTSQAWYKFMQILWPHIWQFILYGLFILVLAILVGIAIVTFGFLSCCIGFLLLIIPYIGSVILLPVSYTYRALSIEFLAQFGEEFNLLPEASEIQEMEF